MKLLLRTTLVACIVCALAVVIHTLFFARVMKLHVPPEEFSSWPTAKKEAYLYEHPAETMSGKELLDEWLGDPMTGWMYMQTVIYFSFPIAWIAAFWGAFFQRRSSSTRLPGPLP